jgi:hypothetical protein
MAAMSWFSRFEPKVKGSVCDTAVARRAVGFGQAWTLAKQLVAQGAVVVGRLVCPAPLQFGHDVIDEVDERAGGDRVGEVEAVDVGLLDPRL